MAASLSPLTPFLLTTFLLFAPSSSSSPSSTTASLNPHLFSIGSLCQSTPYPSSCLESSKLSISININPPSILTYALRSLEAAIAEAVRLSPLLSAAARGNGGGGVVESQRGSLQDCEELHGITLSSLKASATLVRTTPDDRRRLADVRAHLSAALTNNATCLEGLAGARGPGVGPLLGAWTRAYQHVGNSLSLMGRCRWGAANSGSGGGFPAWVGRRDRRLLQSSDEGGFEGLVVTVAADGTGNFTTVGEAVDFVPVNSEERTVIFVRAGTYAEHVEIPSSKTNIMLAGEGSNVTVITGNRSARSGWTTYRSATVAVTGQGFLARDIAFQNTAGPAMGQAVALRLNADLSAVYRCEIDGYQDTLYVHSFRQFYRECDIYGTVDFIFGNAAVIFQGCNIVAKMPLPAQSNVITAQSRDSPDEDTGISIQNCSILATNELISSNVSIRSYLGRPWRLYSTTVYIESYIDELINPAGWTQWSDNQGLDTLYYGEYMNSGPGSGTDGRVNWPGYHVMDYDDASNFTVSEFIFGDEWLDSTTFPYDEGI